MKRVSIWKTAVDFFQTTRIDMLYPERLIVTYS